MTREPCANTLTCDCSFRVLQSLVMFEGEAAKTHKKHTMTQLSRHLCNHCLKRQNTLNPSTSTIHLASICHLVASSTSFPISRYYSTNGQAFRRGGGSSQYQQQNSANSGTTRASSQQHPNLKLPTKTDIQTLMASLGNLASMRPASLARASSSSSWNNSSNIPSTQQREKFLQNLLVLFMANHDAKFLYSRYFCVLLLRSFLKMGKFRTAEALLYRFFDCGHASAQRAEQLADHLLDVEELVETLPKERFPVDAKLAEDVLKEWPTKGVPRLYRVFVDAQEEQREREGSANQMSQPEQMVSQNQWCNYFLLRALVELDHVKEAEELYENYFAKDHPHHLYALKVMMSLYGKHFSKELSSESTSDSSSSSSSSLDKMLSIWNSLSESWGRSKMSDSQKQYTVLSVLKVLWEAGEYEKMHHVFVSTFKVPREMRVLPGSDNTPAQETQDPRSTSTPSSTTTTTAQIQDRDEEEEYDMDEFDEDNDDQAQSADIESSVGESENMIPAPRAYHVPLNPKIITYMIRAYARMGEEKYLHGIQLVMQENDIAPNEFTISNFIFGYSKVNASIALQLFLEYYNSPLTDADSFKHLSSPFLYQSLIQGFARENDLEQVRQLFTAFVREMHYRKDDVMVQRKRSALIAYMSSLIKLGELKDAYRTFRIYFKTNSGQNSKQPHQANQVDRELLVNPTSNVYKMFINAFREAGEEQMAERLSKELQQKLDMIQKYREKQDRFEPLQYSPQY